MPDFYFEINDDVGLDPDGNPQPGVTASVSIPIPRMEKGEVIEVPTTFTVKAIAGTRTFKTDDPMVANGLGQLGTLHPVDPPTRKDLAQERKVTAEARENAGTHTDPEETKE